MEGKMKSKYQHEVIFCIVNAGFTDDVMDAAREFGARGGTVIRARGTANAEAERMFNIPIPFVLADEYIESSCNRMVRFTLHILNLHMPSALWNAMG